MQRLIMSLIITTALAGCIAERRRPVNVAPRYVARCPAGYRYDGNDCHRVVVEEPHRVEVIVR
jgi:hypothetical protein